MKLNKILALALLLVVSGSASALTIVGSNHDLSSTNTDPAAGLHLEGICVYCHSPHNAVVGAAPLWNRTTYTASYTMYDSDTIDMTIQSAPDPYSAACLSCHDGVQALDSLVNLPYLYQTAQTGNFISWGLVGEDLSNDHPISVVYNPASDAGFDTQANAEADGMVFFTGTGSNQVECATCHQVHDNEHGRFLRVANDASSLCLACHIK
jgi:predicted CXXCH cytochrome family protein